MACVCGLLTSSKEPVPLKSISVAVAIRSFVADVTVTLCYKNEEQSPVESVFVFPVDENSAVYGFQAEVNGKTIVAEMQEKQQAQTNYEDAVAQGQEAFLLERDSSSGDVFSCSVGHLPPGQEAKLSMSYVQELPLEADGAVRFVLPAVLNPRYVPAGAAEASSVTSRVPRAARGELPYTLSVSANIHSPYGIEKVQSNCTLGPLEYLGPDRTAAQVSLAEGQQFERDVELLMYYKQVNTPSVCVEAAQPGAQPGSLMGETTVMVSFYPSIPDSKEQASTGEFIFVLDRSGSMSCPVSGKLRSPMRIDSAKETLLLLLKSLPLGCFFNVYGFGSTFDSFFPDSVEYTQQSMEEAVQRVKALQADLGGTEILAPLKSIFSKACKPDHPRQLYVFTDGDVGNTGEVIAEVRSHSPTHRCFSFGIGEGASTALIKGIARVTGGSAEFITGSDRMQPKALQSLKRSLQPAAQNISLNWTLPPGLEPVLLSPAPSVIFGGQRSIVYAQLTGKQQPSGGTGSVCLQFTLRGEAFENTLPFTLQPNSDSRLTVHRLAAKARLQTLDAAGRRASDEEKAKVVAVSIQSGVVSSLTAYVAIHKELGRPLQGPMVRRDVPLTGSFGAMPRLASCPVGPPRFAGCPMASPPMMSMVVMDCAEMNSPMSPAPNYHVQANSPQSARNMRCVSRAKAARKSTGAPAPQAPEEAPLLQLVSLQKADGSWALDGALASVLGVKEQEAATSLPGQGVDAAVWATVLAVVWLHSTSGDQKDEWELLEGKAVAWLRARAGTHLDECLRAANALLKASVAPAVFGL
ncbi:von Willebrand factor A domain-containing protein 5A-like [Ornithorhynchus anatinus]|uniref:von Willebrand factor A domain containing 5A n=1 Tax=Ornithorhynchus anatinus TaxID=9258 RepID=F6PQ00_ORNAN|nr:von Willebrand factor A domain-containing protein 5A-like [Ornithorhynchus anatinus]XP_028931351.1 von Willebrand factor A domain-containing protein 5A-like [Ornithorhynchus anatinus]